MVSGSVSGFPERRRCNDVGTRPPRSSAFQGLLTSKQKHKGGKALDPVRNSFPENGLVGGDRPVHDGSSSFIKLSLDYLAGLRKLDGSNTSGAQKGGLPDQAMSDIVVEGFPSSARRLDPSFRAVGGDRGQGPHLFRKVVFPFQGSEKKSFNSLDQRDFFSYSI